MKIPRSLEATTLEQLSNYHKACCELKDFVDKNESKNDDEYLAKELEFKLKVCSIFSGVPKEELLEMPTAFIYEYNEQLSFLNEERKPKEISYFEFKGRIYDLPKTLRLNTKYGQYLEAVQSEFISSHSDKNSLIYLAHQLAHTVDYGKEWDGKERDKLAQEFKQIPATTALDFSFFLSKKLKIYSLAYLKYLEGQKEMKKPFIKRTLSNLVGLKRYMNWQSVEYLIQTTRLRLIVFYILIQEKFFNIFLFWRQKLIMKIK